MKNKIENVFLASLAVLTIVTIPVAIIGLGLEIKNELRKNQERTSCKKMGGRYTYFEQCEALDGKLLVLPEVK